MVRGTGSVSGACLATGFPDCTVAGAPMALAMRFGGMRSESREDPTLRLPVGRQRMARQPFGGEQGGLPTLGDGPHDVGGQESEVQHLLNPVPGGPGGARDLLVALALADHLEPGMGAGDIGQQHPVHGTRGAVQDQLRLHPALAAPERRGDAERRGIDRAGVDGERPGQGVR